MFMAGQGAATCVCWCVETHLCCVLFVPRFDGTGRRAADGVVVMPQLVLVSCSACIFSRAVGASQHLILIC
jgi:hypothetical protein